VDENEYDRGPKRILYLLFVDEANMTVVQKGYYTCCSWTKLIWPWSKKDIIPAVRGRNEYDRGPKRILYLLVVDENEYDRGPKRILYLLIVDKKRVSPWTKKDIKLAGRGQKTSKPVVQKGY